MSKEHSLKTFSIELKEGCLVFSFLSGKSLSMDYREATGRVGGIEGIGEVEVMKE